MKLIDKITRVVIAIAVAMLILSMFCRCKTKERVIEKQTYITDKRNEAKWDSLFNARLIKELESYKVSHKESVKSTTKEKTHIKDSAAIYHSKCDSLASVISKISKDKAYVEKQLSRTDRAFLNIGKIASVCLFIGILAFLGWIYWKLKLHKRS